MDSYWLGLDLGQANDYSALCIAERTGDGPNTYRYAQPWLERWRHVRYQAVVAEVAGRIHHLANRTPVPSITLVVDKTGVGAPLVDLLRAERLPCRMVPVTITGGQKPNHDAGRSRSPNATW